VSLRNHRKPTLSEFLRNFTQSYLPAFTSEPFRIWCSILIKDGVSTLPTSRDVRVGIMERIFRLTFLLVLLVSGFSQHVAAVAGQQSNTDVTRETNLKSLAHNIAVAGSEEDPYQNITTDPGVFARFFEANVYHAQLDDVLPTNPLLTSNPFLDRVKLGSCPRADVHKCLYYGTA
jgi:hypothetical protein